MTAPVNYLFLLVLMLLATYIVFGFNKKDRPEVKPMSSGKEVMVCPRCGSVDVGLDTDTIKSAAEFGGKLYYRCNTCGFISHTFPFMDEEAAKDLGSKITSQQLDPKL